METCVCVTGAGGFIASWIVLKLLQKGYKVHGTVRDPGNENKYGHLMKLEGAQERLILFKADVLDYDSLLPAIRGCEAVFHTACPFSFSFENPDDVLRPAITGTENVLRACHQEKIKRVVMTSSAAAIVIDPHRPKDIVVDESCWSNSEYCNENKMWYELAKLQSERRAWELSKEYSLNLVVVCPGFCFGPFLQSTLSSSNGFLKTLVDGSGGAHPNFCIPMVDVRDVATTHLLAFEWPEASGRYFCVGKGILVEDLVAAVKLEFPGLCNFPQMSSDGVAPWFPPPEMICNKKTVELIQEFTSYRKTLADTVARLQEQGFISNV